MATCSCNLLEQENHNSDSMTRNYDADKIDYAIITGTSSSSSTGQQSLAYRVGNLITTAQLAAASDNRWSFATSGN